MQDKQREIDRLKGEVEAVKAMHSRILSHPPQQVARAYSVIAQFAARLAKDGKGGRFLMEALDRIKWHVAQLEAELDGLYSDRDRTPQRRGCGDGCDRQCSAGRSSPERPDPVPEE
jgi:hypothetical protein